MLVGWLALLSGVLVLAAGVLWVGSRALTAKSALERAQAELVSFKGAVGQQGAPSTKALYGRLSADTAKADDAVDDPIWSLAEGLPVAGPNLRAFRQVTQLLNHLVVDGVRPVALAADGVSVDSLKPKNGGIDIAPLKRLTPAIAALDTALGRADASAAAIDTHDVVAQLQAPVASLRTTIAKAKPVTAELRTVMPVLYPALGGEGKRHYLLLFQNNAEERASGGNPAAMAMLDVDDGRVTLGKQPNSGDFPAPYAEPVLDFGGDWDKLYGSRTSTYVTNITFTPDFPTTAKLAKAMWRGQFGGTVDGVISFDPVALSYLMRATGPVKLVDGTVLTTENAVPYLLSGVYAKYTDPQQQNVVFASAAQAIFSAVTGGQGSPKDYVAQLAPMLQEQRLKAWSGRKDEEDLLLTSEAGNMLPADNAAKTVVGVYNNDDATSKMSYYMDSTIGVKAAVCPAKPPAWTVTTKVTNTLKPDQIAGLTQYVLANQVLVEPGGDKQWVQVYGPVGAKLKDMTVNGEKVVWGTNIDWHLNTDYSATGVDWRRPAVRGTIHGRPVGIVNVRIGPDSSATVKARFTGGTAPSSTVGVSHTPKVRPVPVTVTRATCG